MPKAYWVTVYFEIRDASRFAEYAALAGPAIAQHGGHFLARDKPAAAYEMGKQERIVITEFSSTEDAIRAHESPEYQKALQVLGDAASRDVRIVEGTG